MQSISDAIECIIKVRSPEALWECLATLSDAWEIAAATYFTSGLSLDGETTKQSLFGSDDHRQDIRLGANQLAAKARQVSSPFRLQDFHEEATLTEAKRKFLLELEEAADNAVVVPVFGPLSQSGYFLFTLATPDRVIDDAYLMALQCVAQMTHLRYLDLCHDQFDIPQLSPREHEILDWVAQGKSNSVIAEILGISANTVDSYIRRIFNKLGVSDRVTAAVNAVGYGLLPHR